MKFKESKYYNEEFLGGYIYKKTVDSDEILTIQEFFGINDKQKEYIKDGADIYNRYYNYELKICDEHYELDCQDRNEYLYLLFDKPVHITGKYCVGLIAPEIVVKSDKNNLLSRCISDKILIDNNSENFYRINYSKIDDVYFYNSRASFYKTQVKNFFIFNKKLVFNINSYFLNYHKIKCFGECKNLKEIRLKYKEFEKGTIHIE